MICKIVLVTLFAVCQGARNEPWWIQMFFPNVSFTGKYHPSNYIVEKSPLFPAYAQNRNDVWSPAYWMPYKLAYAQYWIDLIDNATKAEEHRAKEAQAQTAQAWGNDQNGQFGMAGYGQEGQMGVNGQYWQEGQMGINGQYGQPGQIGMNIQSEQNKAPENYAISIQSTGEHSLSEEAASLALEVQAQTEKMSQEAELIAAQAAKDAEQQMQAVAEEAEIKKQEVEAEAQLISSQAEIVAAEIDKAAQAKIEAIAEENAQFQEDLKRQFESLFEEAEEILLEAAELAEEIAEKSTN